MSLAITITIHFILYDSKALVKYTANNIVCTTMNNETVQYITIYIYKEVSDPKYAYFQRQFYFPVLFQKVCQSFPHD